MNSATKRLSRPVVEVGRAAELLDAPLVHDRDAVGHHQRFFLIVGDVDEGDAQFLVEALESRAAILRAASCRARRAARP